MVRWSRLLLEIEILRYSGDFLSLDRPYPSSSVKWKPEDSEIQLLVEFSQSFHCVTPFCLSNICQIRGGQLVGDFQGGYFPLLAQVQGHEGTGIRASWCLLIRCLKVLTSRLTW